jgi:hypothetical protein
LTSNIFRIKAEVIVGDIRSDHPRESGDPEGDKQGLDSSFRGNERGKFEGASFIGAMTTSTEVYPP